MKFLRVILASGLLLIVSVGLWGQTAEVFNGQVNDIVQKTRFMIGPFRFYPAFKFSSFSWVSNVFGLTNTLRNLSDLVIAPSPELTAYLLFRRSLILSFTENPEYYFYLSNAKYRGFANGYRAEGRFLFLNRFIITGRYNQATQRTLGYLELARVIQGSARQVSAQIFTRSARGTSLSLDASWQRLSYSDVGFSEGQISPELDRNEFSAGAEFGYRLFSATQFFVRGSYFEYDFQNQTAIHRKPRAAEAVLGLRFPPGSIIGGSLSLGYKRFLPETQVIPGFSGLVGEASLQYRSENLGILDLGFRRDISFSLVQGYLYFLDTTLTGRLTFRTTKFLFVRFGGSYGWLNYPREVPAAVPGSADESAVVQDRLASAQAGFVVRLTRTFGLGLTYQKWFRDSPLIGNDFNGSLVTIDLVREF
jgi:hypothetical protein